MVDRIRMIRNVIKASNITAEKIAWYGNEDVNSDVETMAPVSVSSLHHPLQSALHRINLGHIYIYSQTGCKIFDIKAMHTHHPQAEGMDDSDSSGRYIVIHNPADTPFRNKLFQATRMIVLVLAVYALATGYTKNVLEKCEVGLWGVLLARIIYTFGGLLNPAIWNDRCNENLLAFAPVWYLILSGMFMSLEFVYGARAMFLHECKDALTQATMFHTPLLAVILWMFAFFDLYIVMQNLIEIMVALVR